MLLITPCVVFKERDSERGGGGEGRGKGEGQVDQELIYKYEDEY